MFQVLNFAIFCLSSSHFRKNLNEKLKSFFPACIQRSCFKSSRTLLFSFHLLLVKTNFTAPIIIPENALSLPIHADWRVDQIALYVRSSRHDKSGRLPKSITLMSFCKDDIYKYRASYIKSNISQK